MTQPENAGKHAAPKRRHRPEPHYPPVSYRRPCHRCGGQKSVLLDGVDRPCPVCEPLLYARAVMP